MQFAESTVKDVLVVKVLNSRIVADGAPQFKAGLIDYVNKADRNIILDLSLVTFIDSSGLGALIGVLKAMGRERELALSGAGDAVVDMFKLTRMNKVFRMFASPEEAASALA